MSHTPTTFKQWVVSFGAALFAVATHAPDSAAANATAEEAN